MLDTANPSDLLLMQIVSGLRRRYESLNRQYEDELIDDFRLNAPVKTFECVPPPTRLALSDFVFRNWQALWNSIRSALRKAR